MTARPPVAPAAIPFLDLAPMHAPLRDELLADVAALIDDGTFVNGPPVARFEEAFARACGTPACAGVSSGTDALRLALLAAGLEPGDEVIVPAATFVATLEAVTQAGGRPVLADVDPCERTLDPAAVEAAMTPRTRYVLPVHLYGHMADLRAIGAVAERHGVGVLEDACQAHGARRDGVRAGAGGLAGAFSFYPGKNLGAMGDAGAVVTGDPALAGRVRALRDHGQVRKHEHDLVGYTARLDTLQALVLLRKLPHLAAWNRQRAEAAAAYGEALARVGEVTAPAAAPGSEPVWHLYVITTPYADRLAAALAAAGIETGRHYPRPPHLSPAYRHLGHRPGAFPVAERLAAEGLSLPIYPGIGVERVRAVADAVAAFFG